MKLFFRKTGEGKPLIILHGLFGMSDNWNTLSRSFAEKGFCCYTVDLRNHGKSPHSDEFSYEVMADDILELMEDEKIEKADLIGHSMGGKVAMFFTMKYSERVSRIIVVDIAPRFYEPHHHSVLTALHSVDTATLATRKEAEEKLRFSLSDESTVQFLLKNLYWKDEKRLDWRFGFFEIEKNIEEVGKALPEKEVIQTPAMFLRGSRSGYISESDEKEIRQRFSNVLIKTIPDAGHWVHAENPGEFLGYSIEFLM
jgi:pimeloyl-ACP methyl ester carboxylesterase